MVRARSAGLLINDGPVPVQTGSHISGSIGELLFHTFDQFDSYSRFIGNDDKAILELERLLDQVVASRCAGIGDYLLSSLRRRTAENLPAIVGIFLKDEVGCACGDLD